MCLLIEGWVQEFVKKMWKLYPLPCIPNVQKIDYIFSDKRHGWVLRREIYKWYV